ncbi:MAG TPA: ABC transporter permease [Candidatus Lachnoclostridium stercoripullorum]|uniref:ABC transporter permease n=1 Tax=Candidatus Lachnoclostridium stercoripullorum TaxID=2838635 RepID=A0A9D2AX40_9FIRM|nr:ABC transporter permease [Candidatus Lachnoclostridium stercoripullorum]
MTFDAATMEMLGKGLLESLYMIGLSSAISYLIGIPLGIILVVTDKDGIRPMPALQTVLGIAINLLRAVPFIILLIMVLPITELIVGTVVGSKAIIPPLVIAAAPYIARMVESSFKEVDAGVIEAAKSMGANTFQIVWKVLLPEAKPSLLVGAAISITTILGYSAMAGFVGGGGLGAIAINYGYYRYELSIMFVTAAILVIIVQIIQEVMMRLTRATDKRIR